jgi:hypothetical protein
MTIELAGEAGRPGDGHADGAGLQGKARRHGGRHADADEYANVALRRLVKQIDDYITKPHIRRYYDFNMLYPRRRRSRATSTSTPAALRLVIRWDIIQNQAFTNLLAPAANPNFAPGLMINMREPVHEGAAGPAIYRTCRTSSVHGPRKWPPTPPG